MKFAQSVVISIFYDTSYSYYGIVKIRRYRNIISDILDL